MRYFEFVHNLGTHSWDIPTLIVVVILIIWCITRIRKSVRMTLKRKWIRRFRKSAKDRE